MENKKNFFKFFEHGWNKIFGKEEDSTSLRSKSLFRAVKGIQNVGTPHDWEDYKKYKKELDKNETAVSYTHLTLPTSQVV